jgi:uncharacterized protein YjiS (DUF1127 family)
MTFVTETYRPKHSLRERFTDMLAGYRKRAAQNRMYRTTLAELESLSERELDDLGISRLRIKEIAHDAAFGA